MMLSGQVQLCHLLAPNQVYAFNQTNNDLSGDGRGISADILHRRKGRAVHYPISRLNADGHID